MPLIDVDEQIRAAMARGEFDNLPGAGKPQDHSAYFALPGDLRMAFTVLRNAGYVPPEVEILKEIAALREELAASRGAEERLRIQRALNDRQLEFDVLVEMQERHRRAMRRADL